MEEHRLRDHSGFDSLSVGCGTSHIGTGSYTMMAIIAAETLVLPMAAEGGSWTFSSVGSAAQDARLAWRRRSFKLTRKIEDSPVADAHFDEVISLRSNPTACHAVRRPCPG